MRSVGDDYDDTANDVDGCHERNELLCESTDPLDTTDDNECCNNSQNDTSYERINTE